MNITATKKIGFSTGALLSVSCIIIILDQISKFLSESRLDPMQPYSVFPGFDLWLAHNSGAAFSFLNDAGGWQRWFLTASSIVISIALLVWLIRLPKSEKILSVALALVLGGALGNLIDRVIFGYVIDFISVYYQQYRFATFNLADSAICLGAGLLLLDIVLGKNEEQ